MSYTALHRENIELFVAQALARGVHNQWASALRGAKHGGWTMDEVVVVKCVFCGPRPAVRAGKNLIACGVCGDPAPPEGGTVMKPGGGFRPATERELAGLPPLG